MSLYWPTKRGRGAQPSTARAWGRRRRGLFDWRAPQGPRLRTRELQDRVIAGEEGAMADTGANSGTKPAFAVQAAAHEDLERTKAMIAAMPARRRRVFLLRIVEGCSLEDIAERLDLSRPIIEHELIEAIEFCVAWDEAGARRREH